MYGEETLWRLCWYKMYTQVSWGSVNAARCAGGSTWMEALMALLAWEELSELQMPMANTALVMVLQDVKLGVVLQDVKLGVVLQDVKLSCLPEWRSPDGQELVHLGSGVSDMTLNCEIAVELIVVPLWLITQGIPLALSRPDPGGSVQQHPAWAVREVVPHPVDGEDDWYGKGLPIRSADDACQKLLARVTPVWLGTLGTWYGRPKHL
jgi:hypothetical protein